MNCDEAQRRLIDLVCDAETADEALRRHADTCPRCAAELARLQRANEALAAYVGSEPGTFQWRPPRGRGWRWAWRIGAGIAAAALIGVIVWILHQEPIVRRARAEPPGPVEIERVGVSLTILSRPEDWPAAPGGFTGPGQHDMQRPMQIGGDGGPANNYQNYQITIETRQTELWEAPSGYYWPGLALVRDKRLIRHLGKGPATVRLTGVPSRILPDSVRLRGLDGGEGLTILEQNYQYDLAGASAVLARHVDEPITVTFDGGASVRGRLLSFDGASLVIQPADEGPRTIDRSQVTAVSFDRLPEGLLTRPTLVWKIDNPGRARQRFEVAYLTHGLNWRADYVLKLHPAAPGEITDTADLVGYATVTNQSGVTYESAQLKLLAGDVNLIRPRLIVLLTDGSGSVNSGAGVIPQFKEKSFFEYHLYTLSRPTTIRSAETKQIELLSGSGVRLKRGYVFDPHRGAKAVRVVSELKNSKQNRLGKPLPKGVMRLYAPDADGVQTYAARTEIDHTPVDEKVRFQWGFAFDLAAMFQETQHRRRGDDHDHTWEYTLRNHKDHAVTITVIARVPKSTREADCNYKWHVREVGVVEIDVPLKANAAATAKLSFTYNNHSGGGLTSPHEEEDD